MDTDSSVTESEEEEEEAEPQAVPGVESRFFGGRARNVLSAYAFDGAA